MCSRYSLIGFNDIGDRFEAGQPPAGFPPHFNIAPGSTNPVIVRNERPASVMMTWGLVPHWSRDIRAAHRPINARSETIAEKPMFRDLLKNKRCLIPASGFFEWKTVWSHKTPFYIRVKDDPVFAFAGLYDVWHNPAGEALWTYTIITTDANALISPIHNRMPVILKRENEKRWLSGDLSADALREILAPYPANGMEAYPVSERVNKPGVDDEGLIRPVRGL
ncbi:MAG: hypothetical protein A4E35_02209 [Methanoregula sp. PtaU1.Bin051]|nr:MAG: hypothetical protein A4E35_02209 [Methanoregula sp. PtaU1.Bin051]